MFVVGLAGLRAVVKLAEGSVEQVSLGLAVPVSGGAACIVVASGARGAVQGGQRPYRPDRSQAPVFDMPVCHNGFLAAGARDGAEPAKAFNPRAWAKGVRSSPISASTRAPARFPRPGKTSHGPKSQAATAPAPCVCRGRLYDV